MAIQQRSYFCPNCQQQRLFIRQAGVNHILHLLIMVFTCGLWAIIWGILILGDNPQFNCSQCGATPQFQRAVKKPSAIAKGFSSLSSSLMEAFKASAVGIWFFSLNKFFQIILGVLSAFVGFIMLSLFLGITGIIGDKNKQTTKPQMNANSTSNSSSNITGMETRRAVESATPSTTSPSSSSSSTNLETSKKTLSPRQRIEDELNNLAGEDAQLDRALDLYEDYEGQAATATKLKALKRKGQIELRRIELQRKLKSAR